MDMDDVDWYMIWYTYRIFVSYENLLYVELWGDSWWEAGWYCSCRLEVARRLREDAAVKGGSRIEINFGLGQNEWQIHHAVHQFHHPADPLMRIQKPTSSVSYSTVAFGEHGLGTFSAHGIPLSRTVRVRVHFHYIATRLNPMEQKIG
jgi:hypothetical protein